ncbi:MAG: tetratricopeptide repeat protein [Phycisphaerales bacterium]
MYDQPVSPEQREATLIVYDAMEAISGGHVELALSLCRRALALHADLPDALMMLADAECDDADEFVERAREAVAAGRRDLGSEWFEQARGHFWGVHETRPFMRAMATLADALMQLGSVRRIDEAIEIYEEMLDLNPGDNQGVRDVLALAYLQRVRYGEARALLDRYPDDWLATPAWSRVLLEYATGDEAAAAESLALARERNPSVEAYVSGRKRLPRSRPGYYSPGDETEAIVCAGVQRAAWKRHPKARAWLKAQGVDG